MLLLAALDLGDEGDHVVVAEGGVGPGPEAVDGDGVALAGDLVGLESLLDGAPGGDVDDRGAVTETQDFDLHSFTSCLGM